MFYRFGAVRILLAVVAALGLAGCGQKQADGASAQAAAPPARVTVLSVKPETVILVDELPGRVAAFRTAEIRPQVGGILEKRLFEQGAEVKAGQAMFQINSDVFKAEVASAAAVLERVEAGLVRAQGKFDRAKQLVPTNAISREAFDGTVADLAQAKANVAEARATLQRKNLDLAFATVRAPIAGRTGQALASEGALASVASTSPLAIIQQIDRVYVDVRQPATQIDVIREAARSGQLDDASKVPVAILAASGKAYPVTGRALFSDISVDPGTGNVTVRVEVQNPDRLLLPGMYVRARMPRGVKHNALLVPQEAVLRDPAGTPQLVIVDDHKRASRRVVGLGEIVERRYIVTAGLKAGETVVVKGQDRVKTDAVVETVPFAAPAPATD
ncbi:MULTISPECIES: efflux RND transporter periplasmic adaptor subunit [Rhodopseudomonas]|uniref:RND transporter n=1 Tax=Rhodopseudomonas palustris TaxID=1076 RepID=A0A0D7ERA2_RHOPL|nr:MULTISPECIES: efflux RND transporter periplasmic adaptor subunit [Rhodopseudomonas]KIZ43349.1 RND transporter [Rhodopseudomonas palustris]MDF3811272.1 efflux RND transporter periplasmic adaptor subunit [Rhodopseudomonas sp. BAL398]WOK18597.1 efflux RND transporter periplasmic adaptor subunit [Rhodopseudomonas sp. BAL398]